MGSLVSWRDVQTRNIYLCLRGKMCFSPTRAAGSSWEAKRCHENGRTACFLPTVAGGARPASRGSWVVTTTGCRERRRLLQRNYAHSRTPAPPVGAEGVSGAEGVLMRCHPQSSALGGRECASWCWHVYRSESQLHCQTCESDSALCR